MCSMQGSGRRGVTNHTGARESIPGTEADYSGGVFGEKSAVERKKGMLKVTGLLAERKKKDICGGVGRERVPPPPFVG